MPPRPGCRPSCGQRFAPRRRESNARDGRGRFGHERRAQFARLHAGRLLESIPPAAWALMAAIAIGCNLLVGYGSRSMKAGGKLLPILPLIVSIAFMLIADIDSPRHGIILVRPQNLISLARISAAAQRNTLNPTSQRLIGVRLSGRLINPYVFRGSHQRTVTSRAACRPWLHRRIRTRRGNGAACIS